MSDIFAQADEIERLESIQREGRAKAVESLEEEMKRAREEGSPDDVFAELKARVDCIKRGEPLPALMGSSKKLFADKVMELKSDESSEGDEGDDDIDANQLVLEATRHERDRAEARVFLLERELARTKATQEGSSSQTDMAPNPQARRGNFRGRFNRGRGADFRGRGQRGTFRGRGSYPTNPGVQGGRGSTQGIIQRPGDTGTAIPAAIPVVLPQTDKEGETQEMGGKGMAVPSGETTKPHTWANIVAAEDIPKMRFKYIPPVKEDVLELPPREVIQGDWDKALVGYVLNAFFSYTVVKNTAFRMWGKEGLVEVQSNEDGFYFFIFDSKSSRDAVMERGPWHINGSFLILKKWHTMLKLSKDNPKCIPVWAKFYNIPLEYWDEEGLSQVASMVGSPLYADAFTSDRSRISYARICVEISADNAPKDRFIISCGGAVVEIRVEYQGIPPRCEECRNFGHTCTAKVEEPQTVSVDPEQKVEEDEGWERVKGKSVGVRSNPNDCGPSSATISEQNKDNTNKLGGDTAMSTGGRATISRQQAKTIEGPLEVLLLADVAGEQVGLQGQNRDDSGEKEGQVGVLEGAPAQNSNYGVISSSDNKGEQGTSNEQIAGLGESSGPLRSDMVMGTGTREEPSTPVKPFKVVHSGGKKGKKSKGSGNKSKSSSGHKKKRG